MARAVSPLVPRAPNAGDFLLWFGNRSGVTRELVGGGCRGLGVGWGCQVLGVQIHQCGFLRERLANDPFGVPPQVADCAWLWAFRDTLFAKLPCMVSARKARPQSYTSWA